MSSASRSSGRRRSWFVTLIGHCLTMPVRKPIVGMVMGDAGGIGPELIVRTFVNKEISESASHFVIGSFDVMKRAADSINEPIAFRRIASVEDLTSADGQIAVLDCEVERNPQLGWGVVAASNGSNAVAYMKKAVELASERKIDAVVIAPLHKEAMHISGFQFADEMAFLGNLTNTTVRNVISWNNIFRMSVTGHVPLREVPDLVTRERIIPVIDKLWDTLKRLGMASPRIGVAGLNPHAGEGGAFGDEEIREVAPAVQAAQEMGIQVSGPHPADTLFVRAMKGEFQGVVFLYHDQGNIGMKSVSLGKSVLVYSGLPFPCTGPTHGTAYDIAGKGEADATSFQLATKLAGDLANEGAG